MGVGGLLAVAPGLDPVAPALQRLVGIAAGVQFLGTVQAQVDEIAGDVFAIGPFTCGVGDDQGHVVALEQRDEVRVDKAVMADFHGVAQWALFIGRGTGVAVQARLVLAGQGGGTFGVVGQ